MNVIEMRPPFGRVLPAPQHQLVYLKVGIILLETKKRTAYNLRQVILMLLPKSNAPMLIVHK